MTRSALQSGEAAWIEPNLSEEEAQRRVGKDSLSDLDFGAAGFSSRKQRMKNLRVTAKTFNLLLLVFSFSMLIAQSHAESAKPQLLPLAAHITRV